MDRLTEPNHTYNDCEFMESCMAQYMNRLAAYEDTGLTPEICAEYKKFEDEAVSKSVTFARIVELMNADAEGRLIVLPCKVGDTVYWNTGIEIKQAPVIDYVIDSMMQLRLNLPTLGICPVYPYPGHIFLTREEAEAALGRADNAD